MGEHVRFCLAAIGYEGDDPSGTYTPIAANSANVYSYADSSYEAVREGDGADTFFSGFYVDQYNWTTEWECDETLLNFAPNPGAPTAAKLRLTLSGSAHQPWTLEVRAYDYGASLDETDFVPGSSIGIYPLLGSLYLEDPVSGSHDIDLDPSGDLTHLLLNSDRHRLGLEPSDESDYEYITITGVQLVINEGFGSGDGVTFDLVAIGLGLEGS
jgi:hypothetical protein